MSVPQWTPADYEGLATMRAELAAELAQQPPYPEVVGDGRLLRFLRGEGMDVKVAIDKFREMLNWRRNEGINKIRDRIVSDDGGCRDPMNFPNGKLCLSTAFQILADNNVKCKRNYPISYETYNFNPKMVFENISLEDYVEFLIYTLEYKALALH